MLHQNGKIQTEAEATAPGTARAGAVAPASPASEAVDGAVADETEADPKPVRSHRAGKRAAKAAAGD